LSFEPATGQSVATSRPVHERVTKAVYRSGPPKQMFERIRHQMVLGVPPVFWRE